MRVDLKRKIPSERKNFSTTFKVFFFFKLFKENDNFLRIINKHISWVFLSFIRNGLSLENQFEIELMQDYNLETKIIPPP